MGNRIMNAIAQFWVSQELDEQVRRIATAEKRSLSSVYRDLVEKGLVANGYAAGRNELMSMIRTAVEDAVKPQSERLASISAKGTQVAAAAFFLSVYNGKQALPQHLQDEYDSIAVQARKLGIEYLKLSKDKSLDSFVSQGLQRMGADDA